jgi:regulator of protease activity HflC (stomatin/prohibitin superfamily)
MSQDKLPHIFTKFRGMKADDIELGFMKNELYRVVNDITSQYAMMDLVGDKRPEINQKIFMTYKETLASDGIEIETCNLSRIEPDEATLQAIQAVVNAQNSLRQAEVQKQQAEIDAQKQRIAAQGTADSALIAAEGQAKANAKLQQSLTPEIVQFEWIKKWDGVLPQTQLGTGSGVMVNLK